MSLTDPSGWCSPCGSPRAHAICQDRIDKRQLDGCICVERGGHIAPEPLAIKEAGCDNGDVEKSDPALRKQPGSWPNSVEESDMTKSTRSKPSVTRPGASF